VAEHAAALRRPYDALAALLECDVDEIAIVQVPCKRFVSCCELYPCAADPQHQWHIPSRRRSVGTYLSTIRCCWH
jgi:hypothetical protein